MLQRAGTVVNLLVEDMVLSDNLVIVVFYSWNETPASGARLLKRTAQQAHEPSSVWDAALQEQYLEDEKEAREQQRMREEEDAIAARWRHIDDDHRREEIEQEKLLWENLERFYGHNNSSRQPSETSLPQRLDEVDQDRNLETSLGVDEPWEHDGDFGANDFGADLPTSENRGGQTLRVRVRVRGNPLAHS